MRREMSLRAALYIAIVLFLDVPYFVFSRSPAFMFHARAPLRSPPTSGRHGLATHTHQRTHVHTLMMSTAVPVDICSAFDGGNIECVNADDCTSALGVQLKIREDPYTELEAKSYKQWFYFCASGDFRGVEAQFTILNGGEASSRNRLYTYSRQRKYLKENPEETHDSFSLPQPWPESDVVYSYDCKEWKRCLGTRSSELSNHLSWSLTPKKEKVWFAYFAPFSMQQHQDLIDMCEASPLAEVEDIGSSLDGRPLSMIVAGTGKLSCWVIHRQHPGETMAEWFAQGLLERLLTPEIERDQQVTALLETFTLYIIPNMCPDGSARGHLRTNARGTNLNREWSDSGDYKAPSLERSPEVYHTLARMDQVGCDAFVDVHGDETLPYNFISGTEGVPEWGPRLQGLQGAFMAAYARTNSDMQVAVSYEPDAPGQANMAICANQIASRFNCLSVTLEQPFKDCLSNTDPLCGWSVDRSKRLGESMIDALCHVAPHLRSTLPFWETISEADKYVRPSEE